MLWNMAMTLNSHIVTKAVCAQNMWQNQLVLISHYSLTIRELCVDNEMYFVDPMSDHKISIDVVFILSSVHGPFY